MPTLETTALPAHSLDRISLGRIVQIREELLRAQAQGQRVLRLESGDPSFSVPPHVVEAMAQAAMAGKTHYVPNDGIPELRRALAAKLESKNGIAGARPDEVFVTNGAMHALFVTFGALLVPGDEVILPDPMWTEVAEHVRLAGGTVVGVPVRAEDDYAYRVEAIEAAITPATRAIFVNTPHNPTGTVLGRETLEAIVELAREHDLWIVSDEAYEDVLYEPFTHVSLASVAGDWADRVVSVYSFSKSHAMSGLRVGYLHTADPTLRSRIPKLLRCTINGVNSIAQWGAVAAVEGPQDHLATMRAEYLHRRNVLVGALASVPGVRPFMPRGAFYVWAELEPELLRRLGLPDADALSAHLASQGIGSAPGSAFGETGETSIRFAYSCARAMVEAGAAALRTVLAGEGEREHNR